MPTKFLKPKNMRRGLLALLLAAPLVYMFGSLFFALNGAHGAFPFGDDVNETSFSITKDDFEQGDIGNTGLNQNSNTYIRTLDYIPVNTDTEYISVMAFANATYRVISVIQYDVNNAFISKETSQFNFPLETQKQPNTAYVRFVIGNNISVSFSPSNLISFNVSQYEYSMYTNNQNSDYLFGQFFAKDNWVADLGKKAVDNDTGIGLPFVGDLISYIDENAMPLSNSAYGYFIWGYSSYVLNVLAVYMIMSISASLVLIPMKVVDSLEDRLHE